MKRSLIFALVFVSMNAFASKARVNSLQGANHAVDSQTVFTNPAHLNLLSPYLTFEMGTAGANAEGGFVKSLNSGAKILAYLGHQNTTASSGGFFADVRTANSFLGQNNPLEVIYGSGNSAFGGSLSTVDNKATGTKETTAIAKYGFVQDNFSFYAHAHLVSSAEITTGAKKMNSAPALRIGGDFSQDTLRYFGEAFVINGKSEAAGVSTDVKETFINLGIEDRSLKTKDADIYYGGKVVYEQQDIGGKKTGTSLPVFIGVESEINSWAVFRGSVQQNLLVGSYKDETAANTDADGIAPNTTVAAGLGLKQNKWTLDGSLTAAADGKINGNNFITNASVTYNF